MLFRCLCCAKVETVDNITIACECSPKHNGFIGCYQLSTESPCIDDDLYDTDMSAEWHDRLGTSSTLRPRPCSRPIAIAGASDHWRHESSKSASCKSSANSMNTSGKCTSGNSASSSGSSSASLSASVRGGLSTSIGAISSIGNGISNSLGALSGIGGPTIDGMSPEQHHIMLLKFHGDYGLELEKQRPVTPPREFPHIYSPYRDVPYAVSCSAPSAPSVRTSTSSDEGSLLTRAISWLGISGAAPVAQPQPTRVVTDLVEELAGKYVYQVATPSETVRVGSFTPPISSMYIPITGAVLLGLKQDTKRVDINGVTADTTHVGQYYAICHRCTYTPRNHWLFPHNCGKKFSRVHNNTREYAHWLAAREAIVGKSPAKFALGDVSTRYWFYVGPNGERDAEFELWSEGKTAAQIEECQQSATVTNFTGRRCYCCPLDVK